MALDWPHDRLTRGRQQNAPVRKVNATVLSCDEFMFGWEAGGSVGARGGGGAGLAVNFGTFSVVVLVEREVVNTRKMERVYESGGRGGGGAGERFRCTIRMASAGLNSLYSSLAACCC